MESDCSGSGINMQKRQEVNSIEICKSMRTMRDNENTCASYVK